MVLVIVSTAGGSDALMFALVQQPRIDVLREASFLGV